MPYRREPDPERIHPTIGKVVLDHTQGDIDEGFREYIMIVSKIIGKVPIVDFRDWEAFCEMQNGGEKYEF